MSQDTQDPTSSRPQSEDLTNVNRQHASFQHTVWMRHTVWHAQANSKGIVLTMAGKFLPVIQVPGIKDGQVKSRIEALAGQFQFKHLPGNPAPHRIVGEVKDFKVRAEVAEMVWNDKILMDLVFGDGMYEMALRQAKCERELEILELVQKKTAYLEARSQS